MTDTISAIRIPEDPNERAEKISIGRERADLVGHVAGLPSPIDLTKPELVMWVNDAFLGNGMGFNAAATTLLWVHTPSPSGRVPIHGPVVLTGREDDSGLTSIPSGLAEILLHDGPFRADAQLGADGPWKASMYRYADWQAAYGDVLRGLLGPQPITDFRVVPITDMSIVGRRVQLKHVTDEHTSLQPGAVGVVTGVGVLGTIHVRWEDGAVLGLIPGVDAFEVLPE